MIHKRIRGRQNIAWCFDEIDSYDWSRDGLVKVAISIPDEWTAVYVSFRSRTYNELLNAMQSIYKIYCRSLSHVDVWVSYMLHEAKPTNQRITNFIRRVKHYGAN